MRQFNTDFAAHRKWKRERKMVGRTMFPSLFNSLWATKLPTVCLQKIRLPEFLGETGRWLRSLFLFHGLFFLFIWLGWCFLRLWRFLLFFIRHSTFLLSHYYEVVRFRATSLLILYQIQDRRGSFLPLWIWQYKHTNVIIWSCDAILAKWPSCRNTMNSKMVPPHERNAVLAPA